MGEVRYQRRERYSRSEIWNLKQLESHQALSFATAWNNFQGRTTSKIKDLHQILAGMADIQAGGLRSLALEDRMKAIIKCHASLPIDLLFGSTDRMHGGSFANSWAPSSPRGRRLDETFGSMKVFTDCLFISSDTAEKYLQVCVGQSRDLMVDKFQLDIPLVGNVWIEAENWQPEQRRNIQDDTICLVFPIIDSRSKTKIWSESLGARFIVQRRDGEDLHLIYDCSFRMFSYDRGSFKPDNDGLVSQNYPYVSIELAEPNSRLFISCGKSSTLLTNLGFSHGIELTFPQL